MNIKIGDKVRYRGGENYNHHLIVERINLITCDTIPDYYRIQAGWYNGPYDAGMVEARANLFELVQSC